MTRLIELTGSEKQVKWASDLRERTIEAVRVAQQEKLHDNGQMFTGELLAASEKFNQNLQKLLDVALTVSDAGEWIDSRSRDGFSDVLMIVYGEDRSVVDAMPSTYSASVPANLKNACGVIDGTVQSSTVERAMVRPTRRRSTNR